MSLIMDALNTGVRVREVGSGTWLELQCEIDAQAATTISSTTTVTKCGSFSGFQPEDVQYSGNAAYDIDTGGTAVSYNDIRDWMANNTEVEFLYYNKAFTNSAGTPVAEGALLHEFSAGQFLNLTLTSAVGDVVKFSWGYKPSSPVDTTGASA